MTFRLAIYGIVTALVVLSASTTAMANEAKSPFFLEQYERTGKTRMCLPKSEVAHLHLIDEWHVVVQLKNDEYYLNKYLSVCYVSTRQNPRPRMWVGLGAYICRNNLLNFENEFGGRTNSCNLGKFEHLEKINAEQAGEP